MNTSLNILFRPVFFLVAGLVFLCATCEEPPPEDEDPVHTVSDFDGNIYRIALIGDQWWMVSNLKTTHFADGSAIPRVESTTEWESLDMDAKAYCYYDNNAETFSFTYGALYSWAAALNGAASSNTNPSQIQGVCPDGWHIPSDAEWKELEMSLGMGGVEADTTGPRGVSVGSQLAVNKDLWEDGLLEDHPEFGTSGFFALPGGGRRFNGTFGHVGDNANFWTSTEVDEVKAWGRHIYSEYTTVHRYKNVKSDGFSVRCVKD